MALQVCVKDEPASADAGLVCVKEEADLNGEGQWPKLELEDASQTQEPSEVCLKQGESWEDSMGLYADHEVKDEVVLGPENLQRTGTSLLVHGAVKSAGAAAPRPPAPPRPHLEISTYMCDICGKLFLKKKSLIRHIKLHLYNNDERIYYAEKVFFCNFCSKKFKQAGHRNRHVKHSHTRSAEHQRLVCEVCHKAFVRSDSLKQHMLIHSGQKPHSCDVCDMKFRQIGNLTRHVRIHKGEKPYACEVCSRRFTQSCDLKKHMRIHMGDRTYRCEVCAKSFTCSGDLRSHFRTQGHRLALRRQKRTLVQVELPSAADNS